MIIANFWDRIAGSHKELLVKEHPDKKFVNVSVEGHTIPLTKWQVISLASVLSSYAETMKD